MELQQLFNAFYAAANGVQPYPWQCALVEQVAGTGIWPDISVPTGAGKSSVVEIHVFLVAAHALALSGSRPPRRLVLVAPRRVLVDDHHDRALRLRQLLTDARTTGGPVGQIAEALTAMCIADQSPAAPIGVWRLRGGIQRGSGWRLEPSACQVICATPQMWGSRLLFRGYGSSRAARNLESGLLGHDCVGIVDEAHLHERLLDTAEAVAEHGRGPGALQVVSMSATARARRGHTVTLSDGDRQSAELRRRITADKRIALVELDDFKRGAESELVARARAVAGAGTVGVFVNDVPSALRVADQLATGGDEVELVCGRMRPADVELLRAHRPHLLTPRGDPAVRFLVSTQSLEVGVDIDLPAMVTLIAPPAALAQRAGRLNRSGRCEQATFTVIAQEGLADRQPADIPRSGPYEGAELLAGALWLRALGDSIAPARVAEVGIPATDAPPLPRLRAAELETLEMTGDALAADPDIELYLTGPRPPEAQVNIVARAHLTQHDRGTGEPRPLDDEVISGMLTACPPRPHELATLPIGDELRRVLEVVGEQAWLLRSEAGVLRASRLGDQQAADGDTLVVPDGAEICTAGVVGLGVLRGQAQPMRDVLSLPVDGASRDTVVALPAAAIAALVSSDPALGRRATRDALSEALRDAGHQALADRLVRNRNERLSQLELRWCGGADADVGLLLLSEMASRAAQTALIVPEQCISVDAHNQSVSDRAHAIVAQLGSAASARERDALALAAGCHDDGKRHVRFQARMGAADGDGPLAKPRPGHQPDRGDGWRHEQLSAAYAALSSGADPLVVALVGAHHGHGRPLFDRMHEALLSGWDDCPAEVSAQAAALFGPLGDYEVLRRRARDELGPLRLAWLEALLRAADMQVSREGS